MGVYIWNRLPSEYQEVEYIESSGTQYIDTGKTVSGNVKADYEYTPTSSSPSAPVFMDNDRRSNGFGSGNTYIYYGGNTSNNEGYTVGSLAQNVKAHDIVAKSGCSRTLNGTTVSYTPSSSYPSPSGTLKLFVSQRAGSIISYNVSKLYSFKRYDSGVLTQDMIPCYRKSDSVIGLYDLVNNQFYTNSGSGTFTKGSDVNNYYEKEMKNAYIGEYVEETYTPPTSGNLSIIKSGYTIKEVVIKLSITASSSASYDTIGNIKIGNASTVTKDYGVILRGGNGWGYYDLGKYGSIYSDNPTQKNYHSFSSSYTQNTSGAVEYTIGLNKASVKVGKSYGSWLYTETYTYNTEESNLVNDILTSGSTVIWARQYGGATIGTKEVVVIYNPN